jgi:hypothetical protein
LLIRYSPALFFSETVLFSYCHKGDISISSQGGTIHLHSKIFGLLLIVMLHVVSVDVVVHAMNAVVVVVVYVLFLAFVLVLLYVLL